jgi:hypothetical protein
MIKSFLFFPILFISYIIDFGSFFEPKSKTDISMCVSGETHVENTIQNLSNVLPTLPYLSFANDSSKNYSMPLLSTTYDHKIMISWTEKDIEDQTSFCMAISSDGGKTFSDKKVIYTGKGIGNSRMMRAKVLSKKNGSFVAVFSNRDGAAGNGGRGGGRSSNIVYCESKNGGNTWTAPKSVDSDPTSGIVRGFFDAIVMPNDEVAVVYLKDVANSTKYEERDLRMVITKNGAFLPEKLIDAVVCDCCPVNLLVDAEGALNVVYRDNNDNVRDLAKLVSKDNGQTFGPSTILYADGWKIMGCPHSGAVSSNYGAKSGLFAYYSGAEKEPGIRLVTKEGKKLAYLSENTAKNPSVVSTKNESYLIWEQNNAQKTSQIAYKSIKSDQVSDTKWLNEAINGTNPTAVGLKEGVLVAFEVKNKFNKTSLKIQSL